MKKLIAAKSKVKFIDTFRKCFHLVRALPSAHKLPVWLCLPGGVATRVMADTGGQKDDCHNWSQPFCAAASSLPFAVKTFDHFFPKPWRHLLVIAAAAFFGLESASSAPFAPRAYHSAVWTGND